MKRIDSLSPETKVRLIFHPSPGPRRSEPAVFLGVEGEGVERLAKFRSKDRDGRVYEWQAYRYKNYWAYGTSAQRLSLESVE